MPHSATSHALLDRYAGILLDVYGVLLDGSGNCFLVDFDNAEFKPPGPWQRLGMERFNRSLRKVALETGTEFDAAAWAELEAGYATPAAN